MKLYQVQEDITHGEKQATSGLFDILKQYPKQVKNFLDGYDIYEDPPNGWEPLYNDLYQYWESNMPYDVQKARSETPQEWVCDKLFRALENPKKPWYLYKILVQLDRLAAKVG